MMKKRLFKKKVKQGVRNLRLFNQYMSNQIDRNELRERYKFEKCLSRCNKSPKFVAKVMEINRRSSEDGR